MKIVHVSTSDKGGAGIAAVRLHTAILHAGIDSTLLTKLRFTDDIPFHFQFNPRQNFINRAFKKLGLSEDVNKSSAEKHLANRPKGYEYFSFPYSEMDLLQHDAIRNADIIHLHWVSDYFLDFPSFFKKINKPVVWTLHDMNPFTGGCHHADDCRGFMESCLECPQLKNTIDDSYAARVLAVKFNTLAEQPDLKMKIVTPSSWLMHESFHSVLFSRFQHKVIRNIIDVKKFTIQDKIKCRIKLKLPVDRKIIMFIANDIDNVRKGITYLKQAMERVDAVLCGVGKNSSDVDFENFISVGYVSSEEQLAEIYNAADVFVLPSLAENFPNTICESLLCGTPVVAFDVGGIPELINENNGRTATLKNVNSLIAAIHEVLENPMEFNQEKIRYEALEKFNPEVVVKKHIDLYHSFPAE